MKQPYMLWLVTLVTLVSSTGTTCPRHWFHPQPMPAPVVFNKEPTLVDVINVVNANRSKATSLHANRVTLSSGGVASMSGSMSIAGPRQVRLRAGTGLSGQELDLGSNDELFWIWIKRNTPPQTLVGRHDALAASPLGQAFPVRPEWLVEAIGLVYLDPQVPHIGPIRRQDGKMEIHTPVATAAGQNTKVLVLDAGSGLIYEQHLLDPRGQKIASAIATRHYRDPLTQLVLPRETSLSWAAMPMTLKIELNDVQVNPLQISPDQFVKPQFPGFPERDVTTLGAPGLAGTGMAPPGGFPRATTAMPAGPKPWVPLTQGGAALPPTASAPGWNGVRR